MPNLSLTITPTSWSPVIQSTAEGPSLGPHSLKTPTSLKIKFLQPSLLHVVRAVSGTSQARPLRLEMCACAPLSLDAMYCNKGLPTSENSVRKSKKILCTNDFSLKSPRAGGPRLHTNDTVYNEFITSVLKDLQGSGDGWLAMHAQNGPQPDSPRQRK